MPTPPNFGEPGENPRTLTGADVMAKAESQGLKLDLGAKDTYTEAAQTILLDRASRQQFRDIAVQSYKPSMATNAGVSIIASLAV